MNKIRFTAYDNADIVAQSDWFDETSPKDAPARLAEFREQHGGYAYRIQRTGDVRDPNKVETFRYRMKVGDNVYYSKPLQEHQKEAALVEIKEMFPTAEITEEKV